MRGIILLFALAFPGSILLAQNVYTINADSVKLTGCDSSELIIGNHTQNVPGFLFNTGNGRTVFKRGSQKLNDSSYLIGADTLKLKSDGWVQGGNAFGSTGILGTLDNNHLDLYTDDTARLRLMNTGNLLLGTSTDNGKKLQVNGSGSFSGIYSDVGSYGDYNPQLSMGWGGSYDKLIGTLGPDLFFQTTGLANNFIFYFGPPSTVPGVSTQALTFTGSSAPNNTGHITIHSPNNYIDLAGLQSVITDASPIDVFVNGYSGTNGLVVSRGDRTLLTTDPIFTVLEADTTVFDALKNGNIGIGTHTPSAQFHTTGTVRFAGLTNDSTRTRVLVSDADGNLYYRSASSLASNDIIRSSLAVNGTISAKKLQLSATEWPDYVFDSGYRLLPMDQLEKYIRKNNHLPGVPSAAEVEKKGVDVGANQVALLKKIEELALYNIAQEKRLVEQSKAINSLKQEVEDLKKMILKKAE